MPLASPVRHNPIPALRCNRGRRGLTLMEVLIALVVLQIAVLSIGYTVVAGQMQSHTADRMMRAVLVAEDLMEEIAHLPYLDPQGTAGLGPDAGETTRGDYDNIDDFHGFNEAAGALRSFAGTLYDAQYQTLSRSVTITPATETLGGIGLSRDGLRVTVTVRDTQGGLWTLTRFIPQPAP